MPTQQKIIRIIVFFLILILGYVLYQTLILPKQNNYYNLKKTLDNINIQKSKVLVEQKDLKDLPKESADLEKKLESLVAKIPSEQDIPKIINNLLTDAGKGLNIDYQLIEPKNAIDEKIYKRVPIELRFIISYDNFNTYLAQLKKLKETIIIESLDMQRVPREQDKLMIHLLLSSFVMPKAKAEKGESFIRAPFPEISVTKEVSPFKSIKAPEKAKKEKPKPKTDQKAKKVEKPLVLQGIIGGAFKAALINDQVVYLNGTVNGYRVVEISENRVVLRKGSKTKILKAK